MGLFDVFKKKQQAPSFGIPPPPPLNIPASEEAAEFAGNIPSAQPHESPSKYQASAQKQPLSDIEGKISASRSSLPLLPPLPELAPQSNHNFDVDLPVPSEIEESPAPPSEETKLLQETAHELPTFPELPPDFHEEKYSPESPAPEPPDFSGSADAIPLELPSIDVPVHWPRPSQSQERSEQLPDRTFIFLHAPAFKEVLCALDDVKERARQSAKSDTLMLLKNREDAALNHLQGGLESMQRKLLYIDAALFEKQEA